MYRLRTLGVTDLRDREGTEIAAVLAQPKRFALLVYLSARAGATTRDELLSRFWPDADTKHARQSLNQALRFLRRSLGASAIVSRGADALAVNGSLVTFDVNEFDDARRSGNDEKAVALYGGDFLTGFFVSDAAVELDEWIASERTRLRRAASISLWGLAERYATNREGDRARDAATRAVGLWPDDERGVGRLVRILSGVGDPAAAVRTYEQFAARLRHEIGAEPSTVLCDAVEAIRIQSAPSHASPEPWRVGEADSTGFEHASVGSHERGESEQRRRSPRAFSLAIVASGVVAATISALFAVSTSSASPPLVAITPLTNATGDTGLAALGRAAAERLGNDLLRSGRIAVSVSDGARTPRGSNFIVRGSYTVAKESLFYQLQIVDSKTDLVRVPPINASSPLSDPMHGLAVAADRLAGTVAMLLDSRLESNVSLTSSPPTLRAFEEYSQGLEAEAQRGDWTTAFAHFERARTEDTTYLAPLLAAMAPSYWFLTAEQRDSLSQLATRLRTARSRAEILQLERWAALRRGDFEAARRASAELAALAPRSHLVEFWSADAAATLHLREAVDALAHLDQNSGWVREWQAYWAMLAYDLHGLGDFDRELSVARRARAIHPDYLRFLWLEVQALVALGRLDETQARLDECLTISAGGSVIADQWTPGDVMRNAALELRAHGHLELSHQTMERADRWFSSARLLSRDSAMMQYNRMQRLEELERWPQAIAVAESIVVARGRFEFAAHRVIGRGTAATGDSSRARRELTSLAGSNGQGAPEGLYAAAAVATQLGERDRALDLMEAAFARGRRHAFWDHLETAFEPLRNEKRYRALMAAKN